MDFTSVSPVIFVDNLHSLLYLPLPTSSEDPWNLQSAFCSLLFEVQLDENVDWIPEMAEEEVSWKFSRRFIQHSAKRQVEEDPSGCVGEKTCHA